MHAWGPPDVILRCSPRRIYRTVRLQLQSGGSQESVALKTGTFGRLYVNVQSSPWKETVFDRLSEQRARCTKCPYSNVLQLHYVLSSGVAGPQLPNVSNLACIFLET